MIFKLRKAQNKCRATFSDDYSSPAPNNSKSLFLHNTLSGVILTSH